jgi:hypothetical protein
MDSIVIDVIDMSEPAMTTTATDRHPILGYLDNCTGSDGLHFDPLFGRRFAYTDGVKFCRDHGCNWLVVAVLSHLPKHRNEDFIVAEFAKDEGNSGTLRLTDGNDRLLAEQRFDYADAPCDLTFYFENGVLLLSREH